MNNGAKVSEKGMIIGSVVGQHHELIQRYLLGGGIRGE